MKKVYLIKIDNTIYAIGYVNYDIAKRNLNRLIEEEYCNLLNNHKEKEYYIIDYVVDEEEKCEREIWVKTNTTEQIYNKYTILKVDIENENTRYDEEENFPINEKLLKDISGMIYKGIYVWYVEDTNTLIFTIYNDEGEYNDKDDIDCMVFRNYTKDEIKKHIEKLLTLDYIQNRLKK